jgi:hypothetical protein
MIKAVHSRAERRKLDDRLDEALRQTFPASDPVSIGRVTATEPPSRPVRPPGAGAAPHRGAGWVNPGAERRRRVDPAKTGEDPTRVVC